MAGLKPPPRALLPAVFFFILTGLLLLYVDPVRSVRVVKRSKRPLTVWLDASHSMRGQARQAASFIQSARALRHFEARTVPFAPQPGLPLPEGAPVDELLRGGSSEAWAVERLIRLADPSGVHVILSDFLWRDRPDFTPAAGRVFFAALTPGSCTRTVELGDPGQGLPLLAGETNLVTVKALAQGSSRAVAVAVSWGRFDGAKKPGDGAAIAGQLRLSFENPDPMEARAFPFIPEREGLWWMEARLEGAAPGEDPGNLVDRRVFSVENRRVSVDGVQFVPDYEARDFLDVLESWGAASVRRHLLMKPMNEAQAAERFSALALQADGVLLLFAPPASVVKAAQARGKPFVWFSLGDLRAAQALFPGAGLRPAPGAAWVDEADFAGTPFSLGGDENADRQVWKSAQGPAGLAELPVKKGDRTWMRRGELASFFQRGPMTWVGLHPLPRPGGDGRLRFARALVLSARRQAAQEKRPEQTTVDLGAFLKNPAAEGEELLLPFSSRRAGFEILPGPKGERWLIALRNPLAERGGNPVLIPGASDPQEILSKLSSFQVPGQTEGVRMVERRVPLAGLWLLPVLLAFFLLFTWIRRARRE